jgi:hypothetical protein
MMMKIKFWWIGLVIVWLIAVGAVVVPSLRWLQKGIEILAVSLVVFGSGLWWQAGKLKEKKLKRWLKLMGGSGIMIVLGSILHNVFYGIGMGIELSWLKRVMEGLQVTFFILSVIVSPVIFLIATVGGVGWIWRKRKK